MGKRSFVKPIREKKLTAEIAENAEAHQIRENREALRFRLTNENPSLLASAGSIKPEGASMPPGGETEDSGFCPEPWNPWPLEPYIFTSRTLES